MLYLIKRYRAVLIVLALLFVMPSGIALGQEDSVTVRIVITQTSFIVYAENPILPLRGLKILTGDGNTHLLSDYRDFWIYLDENWNPICLEIKTNTDETPLITDCHTPTEVGQAIIDPTEIFWWNEDQVSTRALKVFYEGHYVGRCSASLDCQDCSVVLPGMKSKTKIIIIIVEREVERQTAVRGQPDYEGRVYIESRDIGAMLLRESSNNVLIPIEAETSLYQQ